MGNYHKVLGVLGGMGPFATSFFFDKILELTPAVRDWDHIRIIIDSNPHIPSRSRHVLYHEESPVKGMIDSCRRLQNYPVDFIAIPCNSACYYLKKITQEINIPIFNIIEITSKSLASTHSISLGSNVIVLGGAVTYLHKTYEPYLKNMGYSYIHYSEEIQENVEALIEKLKTFDLSTETKSLFNRIIKLLKENYDVEVIILGCTELSMLYELEGEVTLVDSTRELAKYCIDAIKGELSW